MAGERIIDKLVSFDTAPGGDLVIKHEHYIPDEFISSLKLEKADSISTPAGNFHRVCSIPLGAVDQMVKEGIDLYRSPIRDIMRWLRKHDADAFITTNKVH